MLNRANKFYVKLLLVILTEGVVAGLTHLFSRYVYQLSHPVMIYVIVGAILAVIVVRIYDKRLLKKKKKVEKEIQDIADVVLKKYDKK
ncbi:hypothetical protein BSP36_055 [Bacillus phage BSP36]|uniref:Uncharacterized protein n=1 Tax=Bacillus phage BSP38 TaxID=2283013 RepID=A0A345MJR6_BPBSP|nr:membrane protein [Bacillus phage BSP38]AXH71098.1 hypothetical protein BSP38_056 [Bacillus phage BSP38]AYJ75142.1 hypothetical protein BSP36_055 [Bacillus phage BSP36]